jgi:ATP-dependent DNA helicase RecQ
VRFTINVNHSNSLEGFVQEAGRAGRDRKMALATILYSDFADVDKDVMMYFHNNNFRGSDVEKGVMHKLLSLSQTTIFYIDDEEYKLSRETIPNFLERFLSSMKETEIVAFVKYPEENQHSKNIFYRNQEFRLIQERDDLVIIDNNERVEVPKNEVIYKSDISKAIYRMCCIGLIDDFTEDYGKKCYRIVTKRKADGEYYQGLKRFLMRYYSADRAEEEIRKVPNYRGENEIHKCLGYLTEFIYEKIAVKRKRAIDDMRTFCIQGIDESKDWKMINEELKDFIYYYFNSKYAKDDYVADNGEDFSLKKDTSETEDTETKDKDTDKRKKSLSYVLKYMRVVDNDLVGAGGMPKDNVKHLQGAVRLIRRSLTDIETDTKPILDLLNAFCLFYLGTNKNETLEDELRNSYQEGLNRFSDPTSNYIDFWNFFDGFNKNITEKAREFSDVKFNDMKEKATIAIHAKIIRSLTNKYTEK